MSAWTRCVRLVCASLLFTSAWLATAASSLKPNFIVVFIDDMGWGDFSCFGNTDARTPHIDRLAAEGRRFEQFYVASPICSPSRTALSTGQYPQRWRITSFLNGRADNERRGVAQWLDPEAPMLARILHEAGYATGHFGKWHMGGQRDVGEAPLITDYGFDESLSNFEGLGPRLLPLCIDGSGDPPRRHDLGSEKLGRGPITWLDRSKLTQGFTEAALDFIRRAESTDRPFYVNVWPDDVHSPFFPPLADRRDGSKRALYHAVLEEMDRQLGVLFDHIRESKKRRENTIIVVCSDNGPEQGAGSAGPFRGGKAMLYEGGVRSPLIVWAPGRIPAGRVGSVERAAHFSSLDLVPSLLALAGVAPPSYVGFDGEDLHATLLGRSTDGRSAPLFFRRPPDRDQVSGIENLPDLAVREGRWKLLCEYDGSNAELYDLDSDAGEARDLALAMSAHVDRLRASVLAWHASMPQDRGPSIKGDGRPQRVQP